MAARRWWALLLMPLMVGCASARVVRLNTGTGQFKEALERTGATGMKFTEV